MDNKTSYFKEIRKKLTDYIQRVYYDSGFELDKDKFAECLQSKLHRKVSKSVVERLLDPRDESRISVDVWIATCTIIGLNPVDLLPEGWRENRRDKDNDNAVWKRIYPEDSDTKTIPPTFYEGTYHCYYFRPLYMMELVEAGVSETEKQTLLHATLTLKYEKGTTKATLVEAEEEIGFDGKKKLKSLTLNGEAKILIKPNQVYIDLKDDEGLRRMILVWPYIELAKDVLYSQVAGVLTIASQQHRHPLFEKMVLFKNDPRDRNVNVSFDERIIRGILSMSSEKILIEKSRFEELAKQIPAISNFMKEEATYYEMSQTNIMGSYGLIKGMSYFDCMEYLMQLRNISYAPGVYTVEEHERYNVYSKKLQKGGIEIPQRHDEQDK